MHDPLTWSLPLGRPFGLGLRVHWSFPFVALGLILHVALYKPTPDHRPPEGAWLDAAALMLVLFGSVLVHEMAHALAARRRRAEVSEILLWPLGGLTPPPELPGHGPAGYFAVAAAGPASNFLVAGIASLLLLVASEKPLQPVWDPLPHAAPYRETLDEKSKDRATGVPLRSWAGTTEMVAPGSAAAWVARIAWVNWFLVFVNVVLVAFPLDGARLLQALLWPHLGVRQATLTAIFAGFAIVFIVGLYAIVLSKLLALCLALFLYITCQRQWVALEMGGEESLFGYDFSQGYTSLERDQPAAPAARPRVSWWKRWMQRRAARKIQREAEQREAEEARLDTLLQKIQREGPQSLTDEERRFMKRVSDRYRNNRR